MESVCEYVGSGLFPRGGYVFKRDGCFYVCSLVTNLGGVYEGPGEVLPKVEALTGWTLHSTHGPTHKLGTHKLQAHTHLVWFADKVAVLM